MARNGSSVEAVVGVVRRDTVVTIGRTFFTEFNFREILFNAHSQIFTEF